LETLRGHCEALDRPYESILRSHYSVGLLAETPEELQVRLAAIPEGVLQFNGNLMIVGTPEEVVDRYRALVEAGMQYFVVVVNGADTRTLRLLGERVMPAFRDAAPNPSLPS